MPYMSRVKDKKSSELLQYATRLDENADRVLAVQMDDLTLPESRVPQVIVGLCRAAFAQCKVISLLTRENLFFESAPNRRLFIESVIRLCWLHDMPVDKRPSAVDSMLSKDRQDLNSTVSYLTDHNFHIDFDPTEMMNFPLFAPEKGTLQEQAKKLKQAVTASKLDLSSFYTMWRDATPYSHASGFLAGAYASTLDNVHMHSNMPTVTNADLKVYVLIQLLTATITSEILRSENIDKEIANRIQNAYFSI